MEIVKKNDKLINVPPPPWEVSEGAARGEERAWEGPHPRTLAEQRRRVPSESTSVLGGD